MEKTKADPPTHSTENVGFAQDVVPTIFNRSMGRDSVCIGNASMLYNKKVGDKLRLFYCSGGRI